MCIVSRNCVLWTNKIKRILKLANLLYRKGNCNKCKMHNAGKNPFKWTSKAYPHSTSGSVSTKGPNPLSCGRLLDESRKKWFVIIQKNVAWRRLIAIKSTNTTHRTNSTDWIAFNDIQKANPNEVTTVYWEMKQLFRFVERILVWIAYNGSLRKQINWLNIYFMNNDWQSTHLKVEAVGLRL